MANNESIPFREFAHPYHNAYSPLLFLQERKESSSYYIKNIDTHPFLDPVTSNHKTYGYTEGVCLINFKA